MGFMNFFISEKFIWDDAIKKQAEVMTSQLNFYCLEFPVIISVCKLGCKSFRPVSRNVTVGSSAWFPESFELSLFNKFYLHVERWMYEGKWKLDKFCLNLSRKTQ